MISTLLGLVMAFGVFVSPSQSVSLGNHAVISMSIQGGAGPITYTWTSSPAQGTHWKAVDFKVSAGPDFTINGNSVQIEGRITKTWHVTFDKQGTYTLLVTATDGDGVIRTATTTVQVKRGNGLRNAD